MKKRWMTVIIAGMLLASAASCKAPNTSDRENKAEMQENPADGNADDVNDAKKKDEGKSNLGQSTQDGISTEDDKEKDNTGFTFEDLSKYRFEFLSGAGGWSTQFEIEKDGSFQGMYSDSDMGDTGEGYPDGTYYVSVFSGHFSNLTRTDALTYEMTLNDLTYENTVGETVIENNLRIIYSEAYGLEGTDTFIICLPQTPKSRFPEEVWMWFYSFGVEEEITMPAIINEPMQYGIYSVERPTPLEEAQMEYDSAMDWYDMCVKSMQTEPMTQLEMNETAWEIYEESDRCLNKIWHLIKYHTDEEQYQKILTKQRQWISEKEAAGEKIKAENDGSAATMDYAMELSDMTLKRCEELLWYLK